MNRIRLTSSDQRLYVECVREHSQELISKFHISSKTLRNWILGRHSIPEEVVHYVTKTYGFVLSDASKIVDTKTEKSKAGKNGALVRNRKHGNPGTAEGRKKGGQKSAFVQKNTHTNFVRAKQYFILEKSPDLAEFIGAMLGDGNMSQYQVRITLHRHDDREYATRLRELCFQLFQEYPHLSERRSIIELVFSGVNLVKQLELLGLVVGDKIRQRVSIPDWIRGQRELIVASLRGLFDTDGSVYQDRHIIHEKRYVSTCVAYTSYSDLLRRDICAYLQYIGLKPNMSTKNRVMLRKKSDVQKFFTIVRPSNKKHIIRYQRFMEE